MQQCSLSIEKVTPRKGQTLLLISTRASTLRYASGSKLGNGRDTDADVGGGGVQCSGPGCWGAKKPPSWLKEKGLDDKLFTFLKLEGSVLLVVMKGVEKPKPPKHN
jgi:hypothetical protein